jgi:hypothetical protein
MKYLIAGWTQSRELVTGVSKITDCLEQKVPFVYLVDQMLGTGLETGLWFKHAIKYGTSQDTLYRVREVSSIHAKDKRGWNSAAGTPTYPYDEVKTNCEKITFLTFAVALVLEKNSDIDVQENMILTIDHLTRGLVVRKAYVLKNNAQEEIIRPGNLVIWSHNAINDRTAWFTGANPSSFVNVDVQWSMVTISSNARLDYNLEASSANLSSRKGLKSVVEVDGNLIIAGTRHVNDVSLSCNNDFPIIIF